MIFLNRLKTLLRQPSIWVWTLVFPLVLATLEYAAFGKLSTNSIIDTIELHIVEEESFKVENDLINVLEEIELDKDKHLFDLKMVPTKEEGLQNILDKKIDLLLYKEENYILKSQNNSIESVITNQIIEKYIVSSKTIQKAYEKYASDMAQAYIKEIIKDLVAESHYFNDTTKNIDANFSTIYFYSLIAMMCLYATFWGKQIIQDIRADQSALGIRICVAPTSKYKLILLYYLAAVVLQLISCLTLFTYLKFILGVPLGQEWYLALLAMVIGSFTGISLGMVVSIFLKGTPEKKEAILSIIVLALCILSGLMFANIKQMIDMHLPFMKYINPAQMITDMLYSLYYYSDLSFYWIRLGILLGMNFVMIGLVIWKIRGEKYASI